MGNTWICQTINMKDLERLPSKKLALIFFEIVFRSRQGMLGGLLQHGGDM